MMKHAVPFLFVLAAFAAAGCAALDSGVGRESKAPAIAPDEGVVLGALPASALPKGECGMVLWTLDEKRPAPVFRYVAGESAEILVKGEVVSLTRMEAEGESFYGVAEEQIFIAANGLSASVAVRFSLGFDGGSYLERGLITVETPEGWRTVTPSAGLAGCRSK